MSWRSFTAEITALSGAPKLAPISISARQPSQTAGPSSGRTVRRARPWVQEPGPLPGADGAAARPPSRCGSDAEDIILARLALDVGREVPPLLGEIMRAVIALAGTVIGDVEDAARTAGEVGLRAVRHIAVEEDDVAGAGRQRLELEPRHVLRRQRLPFRPQHAAAMLAGGDLEAAILGGGPVDPPHRGAEQRGRDPPTRPLVFVRL